ncbi:MAG: ATP-dependent Clp protease adaptor ClpS [Baekduia sp.]
MSQTIELPRVGDPGSALGGAWRVIVLNDDHNTFEGVSRALSTTLPGLTFDQAWGVADKIHTAGQAVVWSGHQELAEHYWLQLKGHGLTMAPLEQG